MTEQNLGMILGPNILHKDVKVGPPGWHQGWVDKRSGGWLAAVWWGAPLGLINPEQGMWLWQLRHSPSETERFSIVG